MWSRATRGVRLLLSHTIAMVVLGLGAPTVAAAQDADRQALLERVELAEQRLIEVLGESESLNTPAETPGDFELATDSLNDVEEAGDAEAQGAGSTQDTDLQVLLDRLEALEQRLSDLETSVVLSEPETHVRRVEVWVDDDGNEYDQPVDGARRVFTYQRERVYRRQTISEKIEEALEADAESRVAVGVDAAFATQFTSRTEGGTTLPAGQAYGLSSADLFFTARVAQHTIFFADVVGLSGSPPDTEIPTLSLINGYTARLGQQNKLDLREAWVRTELFSQTLAVSAGRLDLTNYFDRNQVANDETSQFLSDVLVNNPTLGLSSNGAGVAAVFDPRLGFNIKLGFQQSNPDAENLSESIYSLVEVGYVATPFPAGEGNYRLWFRSDNSTGRQATALGISLDQKLTPAATFFGRFGSAEAVSTMIWPQDTGDTGRDMFYSIGVGFQNGLVFNRWDAWGVGYAYSDLDVRDREHVTEFYYSFGLSDRLRLSAHLQYFKVLPMATESFGYLAPGVRFQAGF